MKLIILQDRCVGHGLCEAVAPEVFTVGDEGLTHLLVDEMSDQERKLAKQAVDACPSSALHIDESDEEN